MLTSALHASHFCIQPCKWACSCFSHAHHAIPALPFSKYTKTFLQFNFLRKEHRGRGWPVQIYHIVCSPLATDGGLLKTYRAVLPISTVYSRSRWLPRASRVLARERCTASKAKARTSWVSTRASRSCCCEGSMKTGWRVNWTERWAYFQPTTSRSNWGARLVSRSL